jgi:uncharacterized alkaline shock family protein YloU
MSALAQASTPVGSVTPTAGAAADRRNRGRLVLSDGVVEKVASQAVAEVGAAYGTSGGFLGFGARADATARPRVQVSLTRNFADVKVQAGVAYPVSLRQAADQIRAAVVARVRALTGVEVHRVDVEIAFLALDPDVAADRSSPDQRRLR